LQTTMNHTLINKLGLLLIGLLLFTIIGCSQKTETSSKDKRVYAKIGSQKVMRKDLDKTLAFIKRAERNASTFEGEKGLDNLIKRHLDDALMLKDARRLGYAKDEKIVGEIDQYTRYLLLKKYKEEVVTKRSGIEDKVLKAYYKDQRDKYKEKASILLKHILCETDEDAKKIIESLKNGEKFDELVENHAIPPHIV